jgi:pimeloyl-ACP methyl ester carboxylesterase
MDELGWTIYVSHSEHPVERLVVFVHGFAGNAVKTWLQFPNIEDDQEWWAASDLLFVGYRSTKDSVTGVAHALRRELPAFYPQPHPVAFSLNGKSARENLSNYEQLLIVGHSLGGLIVRRALCDEAQKWLDVGSPAPQPSLLDCELRLFSPASAGFRPAGLMGMVQATGVWKTIEMVLRSSSAYTDVQRDSEVIRETRSRTEALVRGGGFDMLKAHILWANPENVVVSERYTTDWVDDAWPETTHSSVCKPRKDQFPQPWLFVEKGSV